MGSHESRVAQIPENAADGLMGGQRAVISSEPPVEINGDLSNDGAGAGMDGLASYLTAGG